MGAVAPPWVADWIGLPYVDKGRGPKAFDCWGIVRAALLAAYGLALPSYADSYTVASDHRSVTAAVQAGLLDGWRAVARPQAGDIVILNVGNRPWHCGLVVADNLFLHIQPGTTSNMERLDSLQWRNRIEGYYRHD